MASMYRRNGIWYAKWTERGKDCRKSLKTKSVQRARAKLHEIEETLEAGKPVGHRQDIAIDEFTPAFLDHIALTKRPYTVKTLDHYWKRLVAWAKPLRLSDITPEKLTKYSLYLLQEGYEKSTVRATLTALSSIFRTAMEMHVFDGPNPVKGIGLPKAEGRQPRFLSVEQIDTLLETARAHSRDMHLLVALGVYAGLRKNELVNARWGWIDVDNGQGRVTVKAEGVFQTKSGKDRTFPLHSKLRDILEPYRADPEDFILYPDQPEKDGTETKYRVDFTWAFETVCKKAGLPWVTPHVLRHTFASQLAMAGVSLYKIGTWLGHADAKTTQIYAHLVPDDTDINSF